MISCAGLVGLTAGLEGFGGVSTNESLCVSAINDGNGVVGSGGGTSSVGGFVFLKNPLIDFLRLRGMFSKDLICFEAVRSGHKGLTFLIRRLNSANDLVLTIVSDSRRNSVRLSSVAAKDC